MSETTVSARLESVIVAPTLSINDALARLDTAGTGALVLCNADRKLVGLLSDGDIRRAILQSQTLEAPCLSIATERPIVCQQPVTSVEALRLMNKHEVSQLPVVDSIGVLVDFILRRDLSSTVDSDATAEMRLQSAAISDRKSTRLNSSHPSKSRMPSSA